MEAYYVPTAQAQSEFTEKRSRFITDVFPVETEEEARAYLESVRSRYDLTVFVDTPSDERFYRRIRRRMALGVTLEEEADYFLGTQRFRHQEFYEPLRALADVVINGSEITARKVAVVAAYIQSMLPPVDREDSTGH